MVQTLFSNCIFIYIFNYIYISDSRCDLKAVGRDACWALLAGSKRGGRIRRAGCSFIFKETNIRTHTTQQPFHGIQTHPLLVTRKELKKRQRRNNPGKNPKSLQTVGRDDSYLFSVKVSQLCHRSIHLLLSGLHRKRKQGTLFSYPSLSGAICLPEEDGLRCATAEPFFYSIEKKPKGSRVSRCYSDVMHMISSVRSSSLFAAT